MSLRLANSLHSNNIHSSPGCPGDYAKFQAWIVKRLVTEFNRASRRGHYPREKAMREIYQAAGILLPKNFRNWINLRKILLSLRLLFW